MQTTSKLLVLFVSLLSSICSPSAVATNVPFVQVAHVRVTDAPAASPEIA